MSDEETPDDDRKDPHADPECSMCGDARTWCVLCEEWSNDCCIMWGTCWCS